MADRSSQFYPYEQVHTYATMPEAEKIPEMLVNYLLDLPLPGYEPPDDNDYPRCRIAKRLIYDGENPLDNPLPSLEDKLAVIYDPSRPDEPKNRALGYRIFPLIYPSQAQETGQTVIRIYMGRAVPMGPYRVEQAVYFDILSSTQYENNLADTALSRTYAIALDIIRALNGVNMTGVGTWYFNRDAHYDTALKYINDEGLNVGYQLIMGVTLMGGEQKVQ